MKDADIAQSIQKYVDDSKQEITSVVDLVGMLLIKVDNLERKIESMSIGVCDCRENKQMELFLEKAKDIYLGE